MKLLHVLAGLTALVTGAVALYALKGAKLHRRSGIVFVYAMLVMSSTGAVMSVLHLNVGNVIAGVLTFYLVLTALLAVRRPTLEFHSIDIVATLMALTVGLTGATLSGSATAQPTAAPPDFSSNLVGWVGFNGGGPFFEPVPGSRLPGPGTDRT